MCIHKLVDATADLRLQVSAKGKERYARLKVRIGESRRGKDRNSSRIHIEMNKQLLLSCIGFNLNRVLISFSIEVKLHTITI